MKRRAVSLAVLIAALVGPAAARAGAPRDRWPIPPVPPNAYAVVRPEENPLVQEGAKVPAPTIVWEKFTVRPDHPRLMFNKETLPAVRQRFDVHPLREDVVELADGGDPLASAFVYQMTTRKSYAEGAIKALLEGRAGRDTPYVFDWTYQAMSAEQREEAIDRVWATVTVDRATGWPRCSPYSSYPDEPRPSLTPPQRWPRFYNWTFHDQDWARKYDDSFVSLLALAGHHPRAAEGVRNFWEYSYKDAQLFLDHLRDGSYWQGYYWSITGRIEAFTRIFWLINTACGLDYTDPNKHPWLANFGRWLLYCADPARQRIIYDYGDGEMVEYGLRSGRIRPNLLPSNALARDPRVEWLVRKLCPASTHWFLEVMYHDPTLEPRPPTDLPLGRAFPGTGLAVMRSGWGGDDLWAAVRWADWFDIHCHADAGSFLIYCKSPLAPDTGFYSRGVVHGRNYARRTIAHNAITIRDPEAVAELNDGSQRYWDKRTWSWAVGTHAWVYNQDYQDHGDLLAFHSHPLYDYAAGEAAMAYPQGMAKEWVRQVVFLRDGFFVVFDRVETPRAELEKRWLLHLVGKPQMDGKVVRTEVKGHIEWFDGHRYVSTGKKGAVLRCHTLLPRDCRVRRVGGPMPDIPVSTLIEVPPATHRMGTGSRWLWTDPLVLRYNDPLTGEKLPAIVLERDRPTVAEYQVTDEKLTITLRAPERGRVDRVELDLADYKTLLDVTRAIGEQNLWHTRVHYMPGYEYYNQDWNYAPSYHAHQWADPDSRVPELLGKPNNNGSWRIEVYPAEPATRDYFLHVIRCTPDAKGDPGKVGDVTETADRAQTVISLGNRTYTLSFAKTGKPGGHITIAEEGKTVADADFADRIVQEPWPEQR
ncbi:MAG: heparinase II/III family protein [Candidatus Brocadiia bacterium]